MDGPATAPLKWKRGRGISLKVKSTLIFQTNYKWIYIYIGFGYGATVIPYHSYIQPLNSLGWVGFIGIQRLDATVAQYHNCTTVFPIYIYIYLKWGKIINSHSLLIQHQPQTIKICVPSTKCYVGLNQQKDNLETPFWTQHVIPKDIFGWQVLSCIILMVLAKSVNIN